MDLRLCIMSCCVFVLFFHAPLCPLSFSYVLLLSVPFMFAHVLLPLVTTPGLLPPLSSPVPRLFISVCVFSLCFPFTPCLFIVSVCISSCLCPRLFMFLPISSSLLVCFGFVFFDLNFAFDMYFVLLFVLCLAVFVAFHSIGFLHSALI